MLYFIIRKQGKPLLRKNILYPDHPDGIYHYDYVMINGIKQFIQIRGKNKSAPVLLVIHGGPGASLAGLCHVMQQKWEDEFVVVNWDQRGTCKTYVKNKRNAVSIGKTGTIENFVKDTDEIIEYLHTLIRFDKIFLFGFSWGTVIGSEYARLHPEKIKGYIAAGQVINFRRGIELTCKELEEIVLKKGKQSEYDHIIKSKKSIPVKNEMTKPFLSGLMSCVKIVARYIAPDGKAFPFSDVIFSPFMNFNEKLAMFSTDITRHEQTYKTLMEYNFEVKTEYSVPVCYIYGSEDIMCRPFLLERCLGRISAPVKKYILIEKATHMCFYDKPEEFFSELKNFTDEVLTADNLLKRD